jgi:hypothetical protein
MVNLDTYRRINTIIERDSADATYKYALLRGVIEICQQSSYRREDGDQVWFPLGLLVEKWILYYYPLFASPKFIPQKHGETKEPAAGRGVSFRKHFTPVIDYYADKGGFSGFYNDYTRGTIPPGIRSGVQSLATNIRNTIVQMPMKHLGYSQTKKYYSVFQYKLPSRRITRGQLFDSVFLAENFGWFSLSRDLCTVFEYFGSFISGEECLLKKWAEFTARAAVKIRGGTETEEVTEEQVLTLLMTTPTTERATEDARQIYRSLFDKEGSIICVWSGKPIRSLSAMQIDHVLPFSIWKNNDLWNLLPARSSVNAKKNNRIPSVSFLDQRRDCIVDYWNLLHERAPQKFSREISVSLLGSRTLGDDWEEQAFNQLKEKCVYLTDIRGYEAWAM